MVNKNDEKYKKILKILEEIKEKYSNHKEFPSDKEWRKEYISIYIQRFLKDYISLFNLFKELVASYIEYAKEVPKIIEDDKKKKYLLIKGFSDKLVEKGGVAINNFKKTFGNEKTKEFLGNAFYGYGYLHVKEKIN